MLDIRRIRQNPDELREMLKNRNSTIDVDELLALDEVTGAWNQMYKVASQEAVYDANGNVIEGFLKNA